MSLTTFLGLPVEVWRRIALHLALAEVDEGEKSSEDLLNSGDVDRDDNDFDVFSAALGLAFAAAPATSAEPSSNGCSDDRATSKRKRLDSGGHAESTVKSSASESEMPPKRLRTLQPLLKPERPALLHLAHASRAAHGVLTSPVFDSVWRLALNTRWPWVEPQRHALGFSTKKDESSLKSPSVAGQVFHGTSPTYLAFLLIQCGIGCPVCWEPCYEEIGNSLDGVSIKDCGHSNIDINQDCSACSAKRSARYFSRVVKVPWLTSCPCCAPRSMKTLHRAAKKTFTCTSLLDPIELRPFCSKLCGDASCQIECDIDNCDHGCPSCFSDGDIKRKRNLKDGDVRGWVCCAGPGGDDEDEDDLFADVDDDDDDDEHDDDEAVGGGGEDGDLVVAAMAALAGAKLKSNSKQAPLTKEVDETRWWEKKAKKCREIGNLFGECVCGECEVWEEAEAEAEKM